MTMPKFNFSKATFTSEADLNAATQRPEGSNSSSKVMRPGKHEVTISAVENRGVSEKDPSWIKLGLTLSGTGTKEIRTVLLVPTADIVYGAKKTLFPYSKLKEFLKAIGEESVTVENLGDILSRTIGRDGALKGMNLSIEVGYQRNHLRSVRNDIGETSVRIVDGKTKSDMLGADGKVMSFSDYDSAEAYLVANNIPYDAFPSVLKFGPAAAQGKSANANW